jgi:hypothetical protein
MHWIIVATCLVIQNCFPGEITGRDLSRIELTGDTVTVPAQLVRGILTQDAECFFSFSASRFLNQANGQERNNLAFLQSLKYRLLLRKDSLIVFSNLLTHDLGAQFFFDRVIHIHPDETRLTTNLSLKIWRTVNVAFNSEITSCLLKNYSCYTDLNGRKVRTPTSSFLTPLIVTMSFGISRNWQSLGDLSLGLSSLKFTYLRDRKIFGELNTSEISGVPKGKDRRVEYGISFQFIADRDVVKNLHWNCDLQLFKNYLSAVDFSLRNILSLKLARFIKTSLQTRILYDEKISRSVRMENQLNIGLSVTL